MILYVFYFKFSPWKMFACHLDFKDADMLLDWDLSCLSCHDVPLSHDSGQAFEISHNMDYLSNSCPGTKSSQHVDHGNFHMGLSVQRLQKLARFTIVHIRQIIARTHTGEA